MIHRLQRCPPARLTGRRVCPQRSIRQEYSGPGPHSATVVASTQPAPKAPYQVELRTSRRRLRYTRPPQETPEGGSAGSLLYRPLATVVVSARRAQTFCGNRFFRQMFCVRSTSCVALAPTRAGAGALAGDLPAVRPPRRGRALQGGRHGGRATAGCPTGRSGTEMVGRPASARERGRGDRHRPTGFRSARQRPTAPSARPEPESARAGSCHTSRIPEPACRLDTVPRPGRRVPWVRGGLRPMLPLSPAPQRPRPPSGEVV